MAVDCAVCGQLIETTEDALTVEIVRDGRTVQLVVHARCEGEL